VEANLRHLEESVAKVMMMGHWRVEAPKVEVDSEVEVHSSLPSQ
jgi:hypothetical protein